MGIIYNYHKLSFESLLVKGHSFTNHEKNLQDLAIKAFKVGIRPKGHQSKSENIYTYTTFGKGNESFKYIRFFQK